MRRSVRAVVFDLGGVLIDWNPRHLYRKLFRDAAAMERFLAEICTQAWNEEQDSGRPFAEAVALLVERHPEQADLIRAYDARWPEMLAGPIAESVAILAALKADGLPLYALTNWSAEKFPVALARFPFLGWFEAITVSGQIGMRKPDPRIFRHLLDRHGLNAPETLFIDDSPANVAAAAALGLQAIRFTGPAALRRSLAARGLLEETGLEQAG